MVHASALLVSSGSIANRTSARDIGLRRNRASHPWGHMHGAESIVIGEPAVFKLPTCSAYSSAAFIVN